MKSTVENLEATKVKVSVEVPYDEIKRDMDRTYQRISQQVNVPGFRRGKVPARIIDQRFSREAVIQDTLNDVMPRLVAQAIEDNDLRPLTRPEVSVTEIPNTTGPYGGQIAFDAEMYVVPPFELPNISDMVVEVEGIDVTDEDIDRELDDLRGRFATLLPKDGAAEEGDYVTLDLTARVDGEEVDSISGVSYEVGSARLLEGLDDALTGMKADDDTTFTTTLAGGEHAGEKADVTVTVHSVKVRELPEADDDFAQEASEFDTIEELRDDLQNVARETKVQQRIGEARTAFVKQLVEAADPQVAPEAVDIMAGFEPKENESEDDKKAREALREVQTGMIREGIVVDQLIQERATDITQDEFYQFLFHAAQRDGLDIQQLMQNQDEVQRLVHELRGTKATVDALLETKIQDADGNPVDLASHIKETVGNSDPDVENTGDEGEGDEYDEFDYDEAGGETVTLEDLEAGSLSANTPAE